MLHHVFPILLIVLLLVAFAVIAALLHRLAEPTDEVPPGFDFSGYQRKRFLLSQAEYSFYKTLNMAVGQDR